MKKKLHANLKIVRKVQTNLYRRTTMTQWLLETLFPSTENNYFITMQMQRKSTILFKFKKFCIWLTQHVRGTILLLEKSFVFITLVWTSVWTRTDKNTFFFIILYCNIMLNKTAVNCMVKATYTFWWINDQHPCLTSKGIRKKKNGVILFHFQELHFISSPLFPPLVFGA